MNYKIKVGKPVQEDKTLASFFGHDSELLGLVAPGKERPAHLILTLDNHDPDIAVLEIDVGPQIRFIYPFLYSSRNDQFAYRHVGHNAIEFSSFKGELWAGWPSPDLPEIFPRRAIVSTKIQGTPKRRLNKQKMIQDFATIYVGPNTPTLQKYSSLECVACSEQNLKLLASVPNRPIPELNIWRNDFVFTVFWFCLSCKAIVTHNECD